jgi:hypothetical protein
MAGIMDLLNSELGKQIVNGVSKETRQPEDKTATVVAMAMPLLMGAMKRNASSPQGAEGLMNALNNKHDGSILDNLSSLFGGGVNEDVKVDGLGILGHVLGGSQNNVVGAISKKSGMDSNSVMQILTVLAPIVLGYLGKQQRKKSVQSPDALDGLLGGMLGGGRKKQQKQQSLIENLLDGDGDGSVVDDIAGMVLSGGSKKGGLLGGLFGR